MDNWIIIHKSRVFLAGIFIFYFLLSFALFGSSINNYFSADDFLILIRISKYGWLSAFSYFNYHFHPVPILLYKIIFVFWGLSPAALRLFLYVCHAFTCVLVYLLSYKLFGFFDNYPLNEQNLQIKAFLCSLLYSLMYVHTETVIYIVCYHEMLFSLFFLLAFYFYVGYKQNPSFKNYIFVFLFYILSLLSKENALAFPVLIIASEIFIFRSKIIVLIKKLSPIIIVSAIYFLMRFLYRNQMVENFYSKHLINYISESIKNIIFTFTAFIFSLDFIRIKNIYKGDHVNFINTIVDLIKTYPESVVMIIIAFSIYVLIWFKRNKLVKFGYVFIFSTLISYMWLTGYERYLYLPSFGFVLLISYYLSELYFKKGLYKYTAIVLLILFTIYNVFYISVEKRNWKIASEICYTTTMDIIKVTSSLPENSEVYFRTLPDNYNGAWIFRDGVQYFPELYLDRKDMKFQNIFDEDLHTDPSKRVFVYDYSEGKLFLEQTLK